MRMRNGEIENFMQFLMSFELRGRESRLRTRFVKLLAQRQELINDEHTELIRQFAEFNEDGTPKTVYNEKIGRDTYIVEDRDGFNKEYVLLLSEEFVIEENEEKRDILLAIKEIILNCDKTFKGKEALEYDRWCDIVEEINYED